MQRAWGAPCPLSMDQLLATALGHEVSPTAALEQRDLLLLRLVGRLAHEIRNPLSSLHIHVQLLEEDLGEVFPEARERFSDRLEIVHDEIHRLEKVVKQFIRLASPSELNFAPVDIRALFNRLSELLAPEASKRGIEIATSVAEDVPPMRADADQLMQALINLVINALQAIERDGRVDLIASRAADSLQIEVRDTGPGLPPDRLGSIFDPYFTTKAEGTGIGLWITHQIAAAHGGTVRAGNLKPSGAIFTLRFPLLAGQISNG